MARNSVPAEISEEASPEGVDVNALPLTGWPAFKDKFLACFWELEEHLADLFGLNDSKYQWAVDQYMEEREAQKDAEDFAAFEREQEMEMENARVAQETDRLEGGEAAAATEPKAGGMQECCEKKLENAGVAQLDVDWGTDADKPIQSVRLLFGTKLVE